jgi:hypothetical protein
MAKSKPKMKYMQDFFGIPAPKPGLYFTGRRMSTRVPMAS